MIPWGTLTGIRPTKVAEKLLISGSDAGSVVDVLVRDYFVSPVRASLCVEVAQVALRFKSSLKSRDIALYIGVPFCTTRCSYCSFVSTDVTKSFDLIKPFIDVLLNEISCVGNIVNDAGLRVTSVYMGGGTPTALCTDDLNLIMSSLNKAFDFSASREYTVEAGRPDTITQCKLDVAVRYGADRFCINPQSMSADVLSAIGRKHSPDDVISAADMIRRTGKAMNTDLIAGLPSDTVDGFCDSLDKVLDLKPENITIHTLSLKKGSKIMLENPGVSAPESPFESLYGVDVGVMLDISSERLRENGYLPYYLYRQKYITGGFENVGWCLPGFEGIYNISMMEEFCTVIALGGGGVTKLVTGDGRIERVFNAKYPREYIMMSDKMTENLGRIKEYAVSV